MEEAKQSGSSSTSDLFGAKGSSAAASSSGYFSSIFEPPPKVTGWKSSYFAAIEKKNDSGIQSSCVKTGVVDKNTVSGDSQTQDKSSTNMNLYNQEEKVQPFHYSSSLYYGGQDVYSRPQDGQNHGPTTFKKEGKDDDSDSASRGDWWQGSLYY